MWFEPSRSSVALRVVAVVGFLSTVGVGHAQTPGQPPSWAPAHSLMTAGHVDTIRGNVELLSSQGTLVIAVDSADDGLDGQVDQIFVFRSKEPLGLGDHRGAAEIEFWHKGLRLTFADEHLGYRLELEGNAPPELRPPPVPIMVFTSGKGLCTYGGPVAEALTLGAFTLDQLSFLGPRATDDYAYEPEWADPGAEGDGCAGACSVTCKNGSCSASCTGGRCAKCACSDNKPLCGCTS
jgi:hypothetical protein